MKVMVVGASSYVGAKIYEDLKKGFDVTGTYNSNKLFDELVKLDITNKDQVFDLITESKPETIIHVAANASGRWCDENPDLARSLNEDATKSIVEAANSVNAKIIYISSYAAIDPNTLYGKTKLSSEEFVKETKNGYVILRPSLIVGLSPNTENDRPFNRLLKNLKEGTPAVYDDSWKFQPTYLRHLSEVIEKVIQSDVSNETIPVAVPELKSRFDVANDVLSHFDIDVEATSGDNSLAFSENLDQLRKLGLPEYTYNEMIDAIVEEIKQLS